VAAEAFSSDPSRGASDAAVRSGPRRVSGLSLDEERRLQWSLLEPQARRYLGVPPEDDGARADEPCGWPHRLAVHAAKLEIAARLDAILLRPGSGGDAPPRPGSERRFVGEVEQVLRYLDRLRARFPRQQPGKRSTGDRQGRLFDSFQDPAWRRLFSSEDRNAAAASSIRHIANKLIVAVGQLALESALVVRGQVAEAVGEDEEERKVLRAVLHRSLFGSAPASLPTSLGVPDESCGARAPRCPSWTIDPQPRRDLVSGLALAEAAAAWPACADPPPPSVPSCAPFLAGTLYRLILPVVSISEEDWFALWRQHYHDRLRERRLLADPPRGDDGGSSCSSSSSCCPDDLASAAAAPGGASPQELYDAFRCGVLQLQYLGLVKDRRVATAAGPAPSGVGGSGSIGASVSVGASSVGSGSNSASTGQQARRPARDGAGGRRVVYDKPVLVWCGGD
jgi:hypothetical protein